MKTVLAFVVLTVTANILTGCCCPCPTGGAGFALQDNTVSSQARAVAEHVVAQATPGEQKF